MCGSREADAQDSTTTGTPPGARPMLVLALASGAAMPEGIPEDCNLNVQVRVTANGYEGHHDYSIRVDMPAAPGVTLALDFSRGGGFNPARATTWVTRTLTSSPQTWNLHIKTQQHLNSGMVNIGCTPPPPSPPRPPPPRPPSPPRPPPPHPPPPPWSPAPSPPPTIFGIEPDEPVPMGMVVGALAAGLAVLCLCAVGIVHLMRPSRKRRRPERAQRLGGHDEDEDEDDEEDDDDDDDDDDFDEEAGGSGGSDDGGDGESIEALVEVQGQVHEVSVKLADCASFADLSQRVHEACEDAGLPALPLNGLMHMVLSIDGKPVPVTRSTQFARLADAERLRVTIGADPATRKPSSNVGAKKGRK